MKKSELLEAIREVLHNDNVVDALLDNLGLPELLRVAAQEAFMDERTDSATDTVRDASKMLHRSPGWFDFEEEV